MNLSPEDLDRLARIVVSRLAAELAPKLAGEVAAEIAARRDRLWTEKECAEYLGIKPGTLRCLVDSGKLPCVFLEGRQTPVKKRDPGKGDTAGQRVPRQLRRFVPEQVATFSRNGGCDRIRGHRGKHSG